MVNVTKFLGLGDASASWNSYLSLTVWLNDCTVSLMGQICSFFCKRKIEDAFSFTSPPDSPQGALPPWTPATARGSAPDPRYKISWLARGLTGSPPRTPREKLTWTTAWIPQYYSKVVIWQCKTWFHSCRSFVRYCGQGSSLLWTPALRPLCRSNAPAQGEEGNW